MYSSSTTIHIHLFSTSFMPNYFVWTKHGERGIMLDNDKEEEDKIPDIADEYNAFYEDTIMVRQTKKLKDMLQKMILVKCYAKRRKSAKSKRNREI